MILVCLPYSVRKEHDKRYSLGRVWKACADLEAPEGHEVNYFVLRDAFKNSVHPREECDEQGEELWKMVDDLDSPSEVRWSFHESIPKLHLWHSALKVRQHCVEEARAQGADYLFFVDSDNPPRADSLMRLVRWGAPIASGWYFRRGIQDPKVPVCFNMGGPPLRGVHVMEVTHRRGSEYVDWAGMGCYLIHKDVFNTIDFEWNRWSKRFSEDCMYPMKAHELGFPKVLIDCDLWVPHINNDGTEV